MTEKIKQGGANLSVRIWYYISYKLKYMHILYNWQMFNECVIEYAPLSISDSLVLLKWEAIEYVNKQKKDGKFIFNSNIDLVINKT